MQKQAKFTIQRIDGLEMPRHSGREREYRVESDEWQYYDLYRHERKAVVGMKPGDRRVVTLTWDDGKPDSPES